jgi:hypothetical protein
LHEGTRSGGNNINLISERHVWQVSKKNHIGQEFKMILELDGYDMDGIMLDMGFYVNIFPNKSWEVMGKLKLVWSPI